MAVNRFPALDPTQELTRAVVKLTNGYMMQGAYTMTDTAVKRIGTTAALSMLRTVVQGQVVKVSFASRFSMGEFAGLMTGDNATGLSPQAAGLAQAFSDGLASRVNRKAGLAARHKVVAAAAQAAVIESYNRTVLAKQLTEPYRKGQGRLPGALGDVLAREDFIQVNPDGILFGNIGVLDAVAAHWYRLNFGAGGRATANGGPRTFNLRFFGEGVGTLTLRGAPSAPFVVPRGIFSGFGGVQAFNAERRGLDQFFPVSLLGNLPAGLIQEARAAVGGPVVSAGIAGRHYLDAGIAVLAAQLPVQYELLTKQWLDEASQEAGRRGPLKGYEVGQAQALRDSILVGANARARLRIV